MRLRTLTDDELITHLAQRNDLTETEHELYDRVVRLNTALKELEAQTGETVRENQHLRAVVGAPQEGAL